MHHLAPPRRRLTPPHERIHPDLQTGRPIGGVQHLGPDGASLHCHLEPRVRRKVSRLGISEPWRRRIGDHHNVLLRSLFGSHHTTTELISSAYDEA